MLEAQPMKLGLDYPSLHPEWEDIGKKMYFHPAIITCTV